MKKLKRKKNAYMSKNYGSQGNQKVGDVVLLALFYVFSGQRVATCVMCIWRAQKNGP